MCGIFAYIGRKTSAPQIVFSGLKNLEYRGYDSWGVAVVQKSKIIVKKQAGKIGDSNVDNLSTSHLAIGHTRWATHGEVTDTNAHPHTDCTKTMAIIHNGIFENYAEVKNRLIKLGHKFISQTDSEVISHQIEEFTKKLSFTESVRKTFLQMEGLNAIIAIHKEFPGLVAIRNGSPLVVGFGRGENFLSSDPSALLPYTNRIYFLEDDEMTVLKPKETFIFDSKTRIPVKPKLQTLSWKPQQAELGKFPNFMLKEIYEQPGLISDIAASGTSQTEKIARIIKKSFGTYLVGCGTAPYAALAGEYIFSKIARRHVNTALGSEFGYHLNFLSKRSLVIAISQSGETIDILESVKNAQNQGAKIAALVNVLGSSLYRMANDKLLINAGPEKAVASTKVLTGMLCQIILVAYSLAGKSEEGKKIITLAAKATSKVLGKKNLTLVKTLAHQLKNQQHIYVIGRGLSYPAALETALKIKEISYIHAEGLAAGELKHGPLALVEKGTPCIAFLPLDETYGANLAGAMEMKARGAYLIGISPKKHEIFDWWQPVDDAAVATIIPNVVTGQLLAYYLTVQKSLDPDKPRNLAKSVTVK